MPEALDTGGAGHCTAMSCLRSCGSPLLLLIFLFLCDTVAGSEIPKANHLGCIRPCKSWDFNYQPQVDSRSASESLRAFGQIGGSRGESDMAGVFMEIGGY